MGILKFFGKSEGKATELHEVKVARKHYCVSCVILKHLKQKCEVCRLWRPLSPELSRRWEEKLPFSLFSWVSHSVWTVRTLCPPQDSTVVQRVHQKGSVLLLLCPDWMIHLFRHILHQHKRLFFPLCCRPCEYLRGPPPSHPTPLSGFHFAHMMRSTF